MVMSASTHERIDNDELEALDPRWPEPDRPSDKDGPDPATTKEHDLISTRPASPTLGPKTCRLGVAGLVLAALVAGSAGTHWYDQPSRTASPPWIVACQDAINATARLHRFQDAQFVQGMEAAWAVIGTGGVPNPTPIDTSLNARLQRDADNAASRCISP
jgi:hypothetical protein